MDCLKVILRYAPNPLPIPPYHQPLGPRSIRLRQGEVEAQGKPPHPGAGAAVGGTTGWRIGLLAWHDALPAQDQAHPFQDPRAAVDRPVGGRIGADGEAGASVKRRQECSPLAVQEMADRVRHDGKGRESCPLVLFSSLVPCVGMPKTDWVGRAGPADMGEGRLPCAAGH